MDNHRASMDRTMLGSRVEKKRVAGVSAASLTIPTADFLSFYSLSGILPSKHGSLLTASHSLWSNLRLYTLYLLPSEKLSDMTAATVEPIQGLP